VSTAFLVTSLIVVATPGTGVVYTLSAGLSRGARASVVAVLGRTLGVVPHAAATITGLAALLHTSTAAFQTLKIRGVMYMLYLAWGTLRDKQAITVDGVAAARPAGRVIVSAVLLNLLNSELTMFFVAFLPQFVPARGSATVGEMVRLSAVFMLLTFVIFAAYGLRAAAVRDRVTSRPRVMAWLRRIFAGSFVALSARLALAGR
jgi:threonine/homoserine/homoserine lactone efflux protein